MKSTSRNVLITAIGDRDPIPDFVFNEPPDCIGFVPATDSDAGPILGALQIIKENQNYQSFHPDKIVLLYAEDGQQFRKGYGESEIQKNKEIKRRKEWLQVYLRSNGYEVEAIDLGSGKVINPAAYEVLIPAMSNALIRIRLTEADSNFTILTASGTPQMAATYFILFGERKIEGTFLHKLKATSVQEGLGVFERFGTLVEMTHSQFTEGQQLHRATQFLRENMAFIACKSDLTELSKTTIFPGRKLVYTAGAAICDVLEHWERNRHAKALACLKANLAILTPILEKHSPGITAHWISSLEALSSSPVGRDVTAFMRERVKNQLGRAVRRFAAGNYASSVMDALLAYEMALGSVLSLEKISRPKESGMPAMEKTLLQSGHSGIESLQQQGFILLSGNRQGTLDRARKVRNDIVHQGINVNNDPAKNVIEVIANAINILTTGFPYEISAKDLQDLPFTVSNVHQIADALEEEAFR